MIENRLTRLAALSLPALLLCACRGGSAPAAVPYAYAPPQQAVRLPAVRRTVASGKIKYIIIIIQENRTLNNLFLGFKGARTATYGYNLHNQKIPLKPVVLETAWDLQHNYEGFINSCNGTGKIPGTNCRMNGFDDQHWNCSTPGFPKCPIKNPPYSYVPNVETKPYFAMGKLYVLADEFFASDFDTSSFVAHQYMIAGVNPKSSANYPETVWGCPGGAADKTDALGKNRKLYKFALVPCWDPPTLADELDEADVSWAYYASKVKAPPSLACGTSIGPDVSKGRAGIWSAYQAIKHICYGPDWNNNVFSPSTQFFADISSGNLRHVSWVTPTYANSDHGGSGSKTGPSWVASVVNAVGKSKYWSSSAIFILWDDSGGWYDPAPPAYLDNDGLGFRVPLLIISPYAVRGLVSHTHMEFGSVLKFVEDQFGLARLGASDTRAKSPAPCCFDFTKPARTYVSIAAPFDATYFRSQPLDERAPDDN
jgi:phospholipase C